MNKLTVLNGILSRSPFRAIHQSGEYKFYDSRTWNHITPPDYDEVIGTTIFGFNKSCYFAKGIVLGYAQNLVIRKCGERA